MKKKLNISFHGFWSGYGLNGFVNRHPYLKKKYDFVVTDKPDFRFVSVFGGETRGFHIPDNECVNICYTGENYEADMDACDYAFSFSLTNHRNHYYLPCWIPRLYHAGMLPIDLLSKNRKKIDEDKIPNKFCNFVFKNRVAVREDFFKKLNAYKTVMAPGRSCNNMPAIGLSVAEKIAFQSEFKFSIALENESNDGYTTEKIVEAFVSGSVPIYMGDPCIGNDFNLDAFVNIEDSEHFDEAVEAIKLLDCDSARYLECRNAPVYKGDVVPEYAKEENIMSFFEKIFDS